MIKKFRRNNRLLKRKYFFLNFRRCLVNDLVFVTCKKRNQFLYTWSVNDIPASSFNSCGNTNATSACATSSDISSTCNLNRGAKKEKKRKGEALQKFVMQNCRAGDSLTLPSSWEAIRDVLKLLKLFLALCRDDEPYSLFRTRVHRLFSAFYLIDELPTVYLFFNIYLNVK